MFQIALIVLRFFLVTIGLFKRDPNKYSTLYLTDIALRYLLTHGQLNLFYPTGSFSLLACNSLVEERHFQRSVEWTILFSVVYTHLYKVLFPQAGSLEVCLIRFRLDFSCPFCKNASQRCCVCSCILSEVCPPTGLFSAMLKTMWVGRDGSRNHSPVARKFWW